MILLKALKLDLLPHAQTIDLHCLRLTVIVSPSSRQAGSLQFPHHTPPVLLKQEEAFGLLAAL